MNKLTPVFSSAFIIAIAMLVSVSTVNAESPNILVGNDLTVGSKGQDVVVLQGLLSELGYLNIPQGIAMGYFGGMTRDGLARYQKAQGVTPTAGYFGSKSKTAMHAHFASQNWLNLLGW